LALGSGDLGGKENVADGRGTPSCPAVLSDVVPRRAAGSPRPAASSKLLLLRMRLLWLLLLLLLALLLLLLL
jgi:hypothetical protein